MCKNQWLVLIGGVVAVFCLYAFGNQLPDEKAVPDAAMQAATAETDQKVAPAQFEEVLSKAKESLEPAMQVRISSLENSVTRGEVEKQQHQAYTSLASLWDSLGHLPISAHYLGEAAKLANSKKSLTFAAHLFLTHQEHAEDPAIRAWEVGEAKTLLEKALELDPQDDTVQVALARVEVDNGDVMQGVQRLLKVTEKNPDNMAANLILGRLAITSGQYVKAIDRLQKVANRQPDNAEALYYLAEAYKGTGQTDEAIRLFEKCKELVNDPGFSKEIDQYINSFK